MPLIPRRLTLAAATILVACGDSSGPSASSAIGRDSASTAVFAVVGGLSWGADQVPTDVIISATYPGAGLLRGRVSTPSFTSTITLGITSTGIGIYGMNVDAYGGFHYQSRVGDVDSIYTYQSSRGAVYVTGYDPATCQLEGTFWFDALTSGSGPYGVLQVRNGVFRGVMRDTLYPATSCQPQPAPPSRGTP